MGCPLSSSSMCGARSRSFAGTRSSHTFGGSITWSSTDTIFGISVNNNPTVQDLWTSTPAWGYPYITSPLVPGASTGDIEWSVSHNAGRDADVAFSNEL